MSRPSTSTDAFQTQLNTYYTGLITKLEECSDAKLQNVLRQMSHATAKLTQDKEVVDSESYVRDRISGILQTSLIFKMAVALFENAQAQNPQFVKENFPALFDEVEEFLNDPELGYVYNNEDFFTTKLRENFFDNESAQSRRAFISLIDSTFFPEADLRSPDNKTKRLELYGRKLVEIEREKLKSKPVGEGYDADYENDFYTSHAKAFTNPADLENLLAISSGFRPGNLSWLINQIAEYEEEEVFDYVVGKILADDEVGHLLDEDLVNFIIHAASTQVDGQEAGAGSLAREYDQRLLSTGGFVVDSMQKYFSEVNVKQLVAAAKTEFVYAADLASDDELDDFRQTFNSAHSRHDLVMQNQCWTIFDLLQRRMRLARENDEDLDDVFQQAMEDFTNRVESFHFRVYPQHSTDKLVYSAKKERKVAAIEMATLLGEVEEVGRAVVQSFKDLANAPEDRTNFVAPILCFVVTDKKHAKGGDHGRIIVPVPIELDHKYREMLLSKDPADKVFEKKDFASGVSEHSNFYSLAQADSAKGIEIFKSKVPQAPQDPYSDEDDLQLKFDHSERVLFHALKQRQNVTAIVSSLQKELETSLGHKLNGEHKVYATAMLMYSTHGICQYCSPTIIAHENYLNQSFLTLLTEELNKSPHFKTRGYGTADAKKKFRLSTIVTCDDAHSEQSIDVTEEALAGGKKIVPEFHNPKAKIYLDEDAIDLHKSELTDSGLLHEQQHSFYEFIGANFRDRKTANAGAAGHDFTFHGKTFMSGSKVDKLRNHPTRVDRALGGEVSEKGQAELRRRVEDLNERARSVVSSRSAVRVVDVDKAPFVRR